ncbi:MAG TPA: lipase family protein [Dongiaceae bacterium]|nr:lipase family protein [Dongiaceae bacterium]
MRFALAFTLSLAASLPAVANAMERLPPPEELARRIQPTPIRNDVLFTPEENIESFAAGEIILWRPLNQPKLNIRREVTAYQFKVRSNDANDVPVAVTATLFIPVTPWAGDGARPVVVNNQAIDSLGARCTPSYKFAHGPQSNELPAVTDRLLANGYAVLVPDHQGPMMAYGEGTMAAHAILDSIRGLKQLHEAGLADSPLAMVGYSGGAIATGWAAELQPTYAPELEIVGAVAGGTPADLGLLPHTMNKTWGSGLYKSAILGILRQHSELLPLLNQAGAALATSPFKDQCAELLAPAGLALLPIEWLVSERDLFARPEVQALLESTRMGEQAPPMPIYLYHGSRDQWIPKAGAAQLQADWCAQGANVTYQQVPGEHAIAAFTGVAGFMEWLEQRFAGVPAPEGCP